MRMISDNRTFHFGLR